MNRRNFLSALIALPLLKFLKPKTEPASRAFTDQDCEEFNRKAEAVWQDPYWDRIAKAQIDPSDYIDRRALVYDVDGNLAAVIFFDMEQGKLGLENIS